MELNAEKLTSLQAKFIELTESQFGETEGWYQTNTREGIFGTALVIWLWMLQIMNGSSMSGVMGLLHEGAAELVLSKNEASKRVQNNKISSNTGGYSRARSRVPEVDIEEVTELLAEATRRTINAQHKEGQRIYDIDGTLVTLSNTESISEKYPAHTGRKGKYNHPLIRIVFASDLISGTCVKPVYGACSGEDALSEQRLGCEVIDKLEPGSLMIGDRNFGVFSVISHAHVQSKEVLVRLSKTHAHKFLKEEKERGEVDKEVQWQKSYRDTLIQEEDDITVEGRFIRTKLERAGFKPMILYFFTTSKLPVAKLVELYGLRVHIETDIRHLKSLFKMEQLYVKTPDMVRKHLHILFATYNLLRTIVAETARSIGVEPRRISFTSAVMYVKIYGAKILKATSIEEIRDCEERLRTSLRQTLLPNRTRTRHEPRMLTRRRSAYPVMRTNRASVKKRLKIPQF